MDYALTPRIFLFSHYFYTGLRIGVGVVGLTFLARALTDLPTALAVAIGALCTSLMDLPSPLRHKFNEMLAAVLLCSIVACAVSLSTPYPWLLGTMVVLVSFLASMMVAYGRKAMPLQFAAMLIMTLSTGHETTPLQSLRHASLFLAGGLAYTAYAMAVVWLLQRRLRQQVLAEALYALVAYLDIKADCYDESKDLAAQFARLVRQQSVLAEKQQASRDLILRGKHTPGDQLLVQVHYAMIDLYELVLATHTDYALLRAQFAGSPLLRQFSDLVRATGRDIEAVAYAMLRDRRPQALGDCSTRLQALELALQEIDASARPPQARTVLRVAVQKLGDVIETVAQMHRAAREPGAPLPLIGAADMTPFLTQQRYEAVVLRSQLRWSSPVFRFALRTAMAISLGLVVAGWLPYASHGYWIALTIAVILKPSFSMTRQRRTDRLIGTLTGCILTAIILRFVHAPVLLIGFLFLATAAGPAFLYVRYRYTAVAASMQILLLMGLSSPNIASLIGERLLDTLIGTVIATFFSYVLPSWEYQALPRLIAAVLAASKQYVQASRDLLQQGTVDDFLYRLSRKRLMDNVANLSAALERMRNEPESRQRAADAINQFTVRNYLLVSHFAALRLLLQRFRDGVPEAAMRAYLEQVCAQVVETLEHAERHLRGAAPAAVNHAPLAALDEGWPGAHIFQRRACLLLEDARSIGEGSAAIAEALSSTPRSTPS